MRDAFFLGCSAIIAGIANFGCAIVFPSDVLSGLILRPDVTCTELAEELQLGPLREGGDPAEVGFQFESFEVASANGQPLSGWFVPAQVDGVLEADPLGTALILHGTDGSLSCTLPWVAVAANNRMNAVVFDYQGYGESGGSADIATHLDDAEAVLEWILEDPSPARQQVHLLGISLGTGSALGLATLRSRPQIQSVALDSAFDPELMVAELIPLVGPIFPFAECSARVGFDWLFETRTRLGEITAPVMFMHATADGMTPLAGAEAMFAAVGSPWKTIWLFGDLGHVQPLFLDERPYVSLLVTFWRDPSAEPNYMAYLIDPTIRIPALTP